MIKANPGDTIWVKQDDGNVIMIIVGSDRVIVKANNIGTKLEIRHSSDFTLAAKAINRG